MIASLESVSKSYRKNGHAVPALVDASLALAPGDFVAVQGKSGCGKSTMLLAAGGLLRPEQGRVVVDGQDLYQLSPNQRAVYRGPRSGSSSSSFT